MMQKWRVAATLCRAQPSLSRALSSSSSSSLQELAIEAVPREFTGRRVAARERAQGRIPAVIFERNNSFPVSRKRLITADRNHILTLLGSVEEPFFLSRTFDLRILAGPGSSHVLESGTVLPIKVHRNSETGEILNLVLVWAMDGGELEVDVPIVFNGASDCPGIKKGGALRKIRTSLKYLCPANNILPKIDVDLSNLDIGDRIFMRDIKVDPSLKLLSKNDTFPICKIVSEKL
ncbi:uncharacterized protein LOC116249817 isoform X1 [Nymphaea colorata]|nr:uncharacterized protein LOC116249817 isoform X1 [Nymphaea colorata]